MVIKGENREGGNKMEKVLKGEKGEGGGKRRERENQVVIKWRRW